MAPPSQEQYEIVITGADGWNKWRERNPDVVISLAGVPLGGMNLDGVNFTEADLRDADFGGASLANSHFDSANLSGSNLNGADLSLSNLRAANLTGAYVMATQFIHTRLDGAIFVAAMMDGTVLADVDLSKVSGLDSVKHHGPSLIGLETIYKSQGKIPDTFLRGCGMPESFVTQMHSLVGAEEARISQKKCANTSFPTFQTGKITTNSRLPSLVCLKTFGRKTLRRPLLMKTKETYE